MTDLNAYERKQQPELAYEKVKKQVSDWPQTFVKSNESNVQVSQISGPANLWMAAIAQGSADSSV